MSTQAVYSPNQAAAAAFLGGPLAGLYFLKHNFRVLQRTEQEQLTVRYGGIFMVAMMAILPFIPESVPGLPFAVAFVVVSRMLVEKYQFSKQDIIDAPELEFQSNWLVFGVSLLCMVIFLAISFAVIFALISAGIIPAEY
ncbi:hypothetical protein ACS8E9_15335 [Pseudomonas neustonica]|uniref:hypothetical protein n=1 Tax=Pseudomonas neustonica TaxID=2487346 RepID=UPI003F44666C